MDKLFLFQQKVGAIQKDSTNPYFKSKYFDINKLLEEIKPIFNEIGLLLLQPLTTIDGKPAIKTIIYDGDKPLIESIVVIPESNDPQKMGATCTYFRRFALQSLLSLQAEDDDGNTASGIKTAPERKIEAHSATPQANQTQQTVCQRCGAPLRLSQKTGRMYCSAFCWKTTPSYAPVNTGEVEPF